MNPNSDILTPVTDSHDMFFSCCDWESAMVQESKNKLNFHECGHFNTETKRVRKMNEKELTCSSFEDQTSTFDVDAVMRKAGATNHPERQIPAKKLL